MASVSSAGRDRRLLRLAARELDEPGRHLGTRHEPEAAARLDHLERAPLLRRADAASAPTSSRAASADGRSSTSWITLGSTGVSEANRSASRTSTGSVMRLASSACSAGRSRRLPHAHGVLVDGDLTEELGLPGAHLPQPHQLEQRQERDDPFRPDPLRAGHRREEQRPRVAQRAPGSRSSARAPRAGSARPRAGADASAPRSGAGARAAGGAPRDPGAGRPRAEAARCRRARRGAPVRPRVWPSQTPSALIRAYSRSRSASSCRSSSPSSSSVSSESSGATGQEQLGLEVDQRGGHHHEGAGRLEILEAHRLEMGQVLVGDRPHREAREVHLVGAAEMQQQVERADEGLDPDGESARLGGRRHVSRRGPRARPPLCWACRSRRELHRGAHLGHGLGGGLTRALRALVEDLDDLARLLGEALRRSRIAASGGSMCSRRTALQSRHPMPAVRQPVAPRLGVGLGREDACRSNTGQMSGLPGSVRRLRAGSVTIGLILAVISSAVSER